MTTGARMVADVGGTNTRLALFDPDSGELHARCHYLNRDYAGLEDIIHAWLRNLAGAPPELACLAVAAPPPFEPLVTMINADWRFSPGELAERFGFSKLRCLNDFEANAFALPHIGADDRVTLHAGSPVIDNILATVGPGTGLGGSTLDTRGSSPLVRACEPGHMGLAPATELESALFQYLQTEHGEVFGELLLSGPGLLRLYLALAAIRDNDMPDLAPEDISARALGGDCEHCIETLEIFCALLGSTCGDFVLANGAYGGLFVAGGIIPGMVDFVTSSNFSRRFCEKGKMREHLERVPLHIITGDSTGLLGAAYAPL